MRLQIEKGITTKIVHYPGPDLGRADGAGSATIFDKAGVQLATGAAEIGAATQALTEDSKRNSRVLTVADSAAFKKNRAYWLRNTEGLAIEVKILGTTPLTIQLDQPIPWDALTGSVIEDHILEYTTTSATTGSRRHYNEALFVYVVGGVSVRKRVSFDVVDKPFCDLFVTEEQLELADPEFGERRGGRGGWTKAQAGACSELFLDLEMHGLKPELIFGLALLQKALAHKTLAIFYNRFTVKRDQQLELYARRLADIITARQWPPLQGVTP